MFSTLRRRLQRSSEDDLDDIGQSTESSSLRTKSRRPPNTAFRQQRLKSWQPILVSKVVLPMLLVVAIICIPIGIAFLLTTYNIQALIVNYTHCNTTATTDYSDVPSKYLDYHFKNSKNSTIKWKYDNDVCTVSFAIPSDIEGPVYLYYKLTNFYQNHRKYVESYDWQQLRGKAVAYDDVESDCSPMRYRDSKIIYPCGLVANSMFNDTFANPVNTETDEEYEFSAKGIAWASDLSLYKTSKYNVSEIVPPEGWLEKYPDGYTEEDLENIASDERFMNWMKTAALPSFMKLYGRNTTSSLQAGTYTMDIGCNYPVSIFGGTKSVVISTSTILGGRHMAIGICYLIVGGISVVFMLAFLVKQLFTRKQTDHSFLDGLNESQSNTNPEIETLREVL
ncbi:hypothetical protein CANARDRAFT_7762 [[Candida] arabinofermentans NRRL YB-2248]|uniref:Cell division control protein 50 n=1 Tax=[Candida] arabinofermentans NRRL YB-2248 TaxID=983967 RepID=A0A1E4T035_9ASCO|nr:hypothetical protein CANARDRAFT_7762 [[Candida] arabinofermentans NRRL YB-2248]